MTAEVLLQGIVSGLLMGFVYALIAAGLSLIFGLMEIVNFAHGEFLMLAMFSTYWAWALWAARARWRERVVAYGRGAPEPTASAPLAAVLRA